MLGKCATTGVAPEVEFKPSLKERISVISIVPVGRGSATPNFLDTIYTATVLLNVPFRSRYVSYVSSICALVMVLSAVASVLSGVQVVTMWWL
jgi:hypothetical protein